MKNKFANIAVLYILLFSSIVGLGSSIESEPIKNKIDSLLQVAKHYRQQQDYKKALSIIDKMIVIAEESNDYLLRQKSYKAKAVLLFNKHSYKQANLFFQKVISTKPISDNAAASHYYMAYIYQKQEETDSLLFHLSRSLETYRFMDDSKIKFVTFFKAGLIYKELNLEDLAFESFITAYKGFKKIKDTKNLAHTCNHMAKTQILSGNYHAAKKYYLEALELTTKDKDSKAVLNVYNNLASYYSSQENYDSAVYYYKKVLRNPEIDNSLAFKAKVYNNLGTSYYVQDNLQKAKEYYQKALLIKQTVQTPDSLSLCYTLNELVMIAVNEKEYNKAKNYLRKTTQYLESIQDKEVVLRYYDVSTAYYTAIGNYRKALALKEKHHNLFQEITNEKKLRAIQNLQQTFELNTKQKAIDKLTRAIVKKEYKINSQKRILARRDLLLTLLILLLLLSIIIFIQYNRVKKRAYKIQKLKEIFNGQELIKEKMSKDLHDIIATNFDGIRLKIQALTQSDNPKALAKQITDEIHSVNQQIRLISHRLSPLANRIKESKLSEIIIMQLSEFQHYRNIFVDIQLPLPEIIDKLNLEMQTNLYGIFLEVLNNVEKHAKATVFTLLHKVSDSRLDIEFIDNGIGFTKNNKEGIGLLNIRQRAELLKAEIHIDSSNQGTKIKLSIPLNNI